MRKKEETENLIKIFMIIGIILVPFVVLFNLVVGTAEPYVITYDLNLPEQSKTYENIIVRYEQGSLYNGGSGVIKFKGLNDEGWTIYHGEWILTNKKVIPHSEWKENKNLDE